MLGKDCEIFRLHGNVAQRVRQQVSRRAMQSVTEMTLLLVLSHLQSEQTL